MQALGQVWRTPGLWLAAALILLVGAFSSSLGVHQSIIAVEAFGLPDGAYAAVLGVALVVSVAAAVGVGVVTDRTPLRRRMAALTALVTVGATGAVAIAPSPALFALSHALLIPMSGTLFGQVFAMARLAAGPLGPAGRDAAMAGLRALFAVPFVVVLPLWGLAFDRGAPLLAI